MVNQGLEVEAIARTMSLAICYLRATARLARRRLQAQAIFDDNSNAALNPWEHRFLSESLLANLWIDWNEFVKQILMRSCNGVITRSGINVPPRAVPDNSESRIAYEIKQYQYKKVAQPAITNSGGLEPTWAHADRIVTCINSLAPANALNLQSAFGASGLVGPKRIQLVRNACAHKSRLNRADVVALRAYYSTRRYQEPIDIIWATNLSTNSIAIFEWIADLETVADLATN